MTEEVKKLSLRRVFTPQDPAPPELETEVVLYEGGGLSVAKVPDIEESKLRDTDLVYDGDKLLGFKIVSKSEWANEVCRVSEDLLGRKVALIYGDDVLFMATSTTVFVRCEVYFNLRRSEGEIMELEARVRKILEKQDSSSK